MSHQTESGFSVEAALVERAEPGRRADATELDLELELKLGFGRVWQGGPVHAMGHVEQPGHVDECSSDTCNMELELQLSGT